MSIEHLQRVINGRADEKLTQAIREKTACIRQSAKALLSQYPKAKIDAKNPRFIVRLPKAAIGDLVEVGDAFFDALEAAMFDAAADAAREDEVRDFLRKVEGSELQ